MAEADVDGLHSADQQLPVLAMNEAGNNTLAASELNGWGDGLNPHPVWASPNWHTPSWRMKQF